MLCCGVRIREHRKKDEPKVRCEAPENEEANQECVEDEANAQCTETEDKLAVVDSSDSESCEDESSDEEQNQQSCGNSDNEVEVTITFGCPNQTIGKNCHNNYLIGKNSGKKQVWMMERKANGCVMFRQKGSDNLYITKGNTRVCGSEDTYLKVMDMDEADEERRTFSRQQIEESDKVILFHEASKKFVYYHDKVGPESKRYGLALTDLRANATEFEIQVEVEDNVHIDCTDVNMYVKSIGVNLFLETTVNPQIWVMERDGRDRRYFRKYDDEPEDDPLYITATKNPTGKYKTMQLKKKSESVRKERAFRWEHNPIVGKDLLKNVKTKKYMYYTNTTNFKLGLKRSESHANEFNLLTV